MSEDLAPELKPLMAALLDGDHTSALRETQALLASGLPRERIVTEGLEAAMSRLDEKCTVEGFNLLEIMLVGRAVSAVVNELYPGGEPPTAGKATFIIATLEGDVHDLGKNVTKMVLIGKGYRVVDLGKDCPVQTVVEAAARENARAVLVSGLITSVIREVRKVRPALAARGLEHITIVAGGAALKQATPEALDVDYVAETAFDGARFLDDLVGDAQ
ncbi:cobalamin B12-binding domain-containing protein [Thiohalomonas denitrificans]|uniref:cobalamin B12-binding domain-containing protein n=1 Tax=Thiohalomonas denitrificans TaxID=415747 RepID=UPI0026E9B1C6|nr:cobalamin-dependent protein [Thiohalomonas denitrificans]